MNTKAVRLYGKNDIRLEDFELPAMRDDEILAKVICDSLCTSSYKAASLGKDHKRIPNNVDTNPIILGHEFCGEIVEVGKKWQDQFSPGEKFGIQPSLNYKGSLDAPGYSFQYMGGDATYIIFPNVVMEQGCLLKYEGAEYFLGSLSEPVSCVIGACNCMYHVPYGTYTHEMGLKKGGALAILGGTGPMGLAMIDYCLSIEDGPTTISVYSKNEVKLMRAEQLFDPRLASRKGIKLHYIYSQNKNEGLKLLKESSASFDDIMVMAASSELVEMGDALLARDGCLNFFAGPTDTEFSVSINMYNIHYAFTHYTSNSGGNTEDMKLALKLMSEQKINPAGLITHIGGLNTVAETTLQLPKLPGGKKLIYTQTNLPLVAIEDFETKGKEEHNQFYFDLAEIVKRTAGIWSLEAEQYLLEHAPKI